MININTCFLKSKKQITLKRELTHTKSAKMVGDASENKFYINFGAHKEKKNDCQRREREKKKEWNDSQKICNRRRRKYIDIYFLLSNDYWLYTSYFQKKKKRREVNFCSKESKNGVEQSMKELWSPWRRKLQKYCRKLKIIKYILKTKKRKGNK